MDWPIVLIINPTEHLRSVYVSLVFKRKPHLFIYKPSYFEVSVRSLHFSHCFPCFSSTPKETVCSVLTVLLKLTASISILSQTPHSLSLTHTLFISVLRHAATHTDVSPESSLGEQGASLDLFLKPSQREMIAETRMKEFRTVLLMQ